MAFGSSIFLIALGAIIRFALNVNLAGVDLDVVGLILMIAGIAGLLLSLVVMMLNNGGRKREVVREQPVQREEVVRRDDRRPPPR